MKRLVVSAVGLALVVLVMFIPALGLTSSTSSDPETATITAYDAKFVVDRFGDLSATEKLSVNFPLYKHGIFRFFDVKDPNDPHARYLPHDISITRDGSPDGLDLSTESGGRYVVAKIGDANTTITGAHVYVIRYKVDGVLSTNPADAKQSLFYWNLVPGGWRMPIAGSTLTATLPAPPTQTRCAIGNGNADGCQASVSGRTLTVTTGALAPNTPVTVQNGVAIAPPGQHVLPWSTRLDPVFGRHVPVTILFALLALVALVGGWLAARAVREPDPAYPLMYAPPEGIGPAQAAYVMTERISDDAFAATMLQLGEKGLATLDARGSGWTFEGKRGDWSKVDEITGQTAAELGISAGSTFRAQPGDVAGGKQIQEARNGFDSAVKSWARTNGFIEGRAMVVLGAILVGASVLVAGLCFFLNPFGMSMVGLPFGVFAVLALPLLDPRSHTFRTKTGRDLWSRIGGFQRVLGTRSSEARFDFSGRKELYTAYIPWAVAFGVADVWAEKYRVETREDPPAPSYFVGGYLPGAGGGVQSFSTSFNSAVGSAISAYQATQSSSSSGGGGGFSGGGGGGGGGGGSW